MKTASWFFCAVMILLSSCAALSQGPQSVSQRTEPAKSAEGDALSIALDQAAKNTNFTGTVLVSKKGRVLLRQGVGFADVATSRLNAPETIFPIGSVTKRFTAIAVLRLMEARKLSAGDLISKYVPGLPVWARRVRIENLLNHTSGLPDYTDLPNVEEHLDSSEGLTFLIDGLRKHGKHFKPGSKFEYSNTNYALLGRVIEVVSGKTFEEFLAETFNGLEIKNTGVFHKTSPPLLLARGNETNSLGKPTEIPTAKLEDLSGLPGDGGLYSTVDDLRSWLVALEKPGLLSTASLEKLKPRKNSGYSYGADASSDEGKSEIIVSGGIRGFASFVLQRPSEGLSVIVLSNRAEAPVSEVAHMLADVAMHM